MLNTEIQPPDVHQHRPHCRIEGWRTRDPHRGAMIVVLWLLCAYLRVTSAAQTPINREEGGEVTLDVKYSGDPSEITWKVDNNKVVDMELRPNFHRQWYRLNDRANISESNGSLTIWNLQVGDSGQYKAEVLVDNLIQETCITLTVLPEPRVTSRPDASTTTKKGSGGAAARTTRGIAAVIAAVIAVVIAVVIAAVVGCWIYKKKKRPASHSNLRLMHSSTKIHDDTYCEEETGTSYNMARGKPEV